MKVMVLMISILLLVGCGENQYETPIEVLNHVIEESLDVPFSRYKNMTALSGDLIRRMKRRYEGFKPYLSKTLRKSFLDSEGYWAYINDISDHQFSLSLKDVDIVVENETDELVNYRFEVTVIIEFEGQQASLELIQYGSASVIRSGGKWKLDSYVLENNLLEDVHFE